MGGMVKEEGRVALGFQEAPEPFSWAQMEHLHAEQTYSWRSRLSTEHNFNGGHFAASHHEDICVSHGQPVRTVDL